MRSSYRTKSVQDSVASSGIIKIHNSVKGGYGREGKEERGTLIFRLLGKTMAFPLVPKLQARPCIPVILNMATRWQF